VEKWTVQTKTLSAENYSDGVTQLASLPDHDKLRTFRAASEALNIPYFKIQRAARSGLIPTYSILNSRKYVKLSDILKAMSPAA
jgi:hypothetical protein